MIPWSHDVWGLNLEATVLVRKQPGREGMTGFGLLSLMSLSEQRGFGMSGGWAGSVFDQGKPPKLSPPDSPVCWRFPADVRGGDRERPDWRGKTRLAQIAEQTYSSHRDIPQSTSVTHTWLPSSYCHTQLRPCPYSTRVTLRSVVWVAKHSGC